jgi:inward rectifier potassium channel
MKSRTTADISRAHRAGQGPAPRIRRDLADAVRKGARTSLHRDFYFYFIQGGWTRLFAVFGALFFLVNLGFASLYVFDPGCIANARPGSFVDAFFFSVQTMSTIGYGAMHPGNDYGRLVSTLEAALSMLGIAVVAGVVFAKVSRPRASVLFSDKLLVTTMDEKRVLHFRVGNARGNDVVDATLKFTAVIDEITPEGHHFRRLRDLKLQRANTPLFVLTWSVTHEIDSQSPLQGIDWTRPGDTILGFVVTLVGHDGTYGQTIYARHLYSSDDLRCNERFVDIISELDDGRLLVDYDRFHDTISDAASS